MHCSSRATLCAVSLALLAACVSSATALAAPRQHLRRTPKSRSRVSNPARIHRRNRYVPDEILVRFRESASTFSAA